MVTATQAFAAVRARLNAGSYPYPLYYHGDDPVILPDAPTSFAFVVFNNEGSAAVSFGGGRGSTVYRNRARVEAFVFLPAWQGLEMAMDYAETVAVRLRSYRDDSISCFAADVIPVGHGSLLSVPGLSSEVSNYQCAIAECFLTFDQDGGAIVDVPPDAGGGGDAYVAKAVHSDMSDDLWLSNEALVAADSQFLSFSIWLKTDFATGPYVWILDPTGVASNCHGSGSSGFSVSLGDVSGNILRISGPSNGVPWNANTWTHVLCSMDTLSGTAALYFNDVKIDLTSYLQAIGDPFSMAYNNLQFVLLGDAHSGWGDSYVGDISDAWIAPGVSILTAGDIAQADRRKFIDANGKPVNPSGFRSAPILFSGDATSFATNKGTGGAFTLTGALTDASTNPSA
jgi:hypothetical protein